MTMPETDKQIHRLTEALCVALDALEKIEKTAGTNATTGVEAGRLLERCLIEASGAKEPIREHIVGLLADDMGGPPDEG